MNELHTHIKLLDSLPHDRRSKFVIATIRCGQCRGRLVEVLATTPPAVMWWDLKTSDELAGKDSTLDFIAPDDPLRHTLPPIVPRGDGPSSTAPRRSTRRVVVPLDQLSSRDAIGGICRCRFIPLDPLSVRSMLSEGVTERVI